MSNAKDELRDARRANLALKTALSLLADKISEAQTATVGRDRETAMQALRKAADYTEEMHGYLAAALDAHHSLGRCLSETTPEAA